MFKVGQKIYQKVGKFNGTVLEVAGNTVYIELSNGVEAEFLVADMTDIKPVVGRPEGVDNSGLITMADFTPEHQSVLDAVPELVKNAIGGMYERLPFSGKWDSLNSAQQLNLICALSRIPYEVARKYVDKSGTMAILMAHGIGKTAGIVD